MDKVKYKQLAAVSDEWVQDGASSVARAVEQDFSALIAIFDRHLKSRFEIGAEVKSALSEAKAAAQRGLTLSHRLVDLLRDTRPRT